MTLRPPCPDEATLQRFILESGSREDSEILTHIKNCPKCRFLVEQLTEELKDLASKWQMMAWRGAIELTELRFAEETDISSPTLLAAQGEDTDSDSGTCSVTLASPDRNLILHAVRDTESGDLWLYVKSDQADQYKNVLVRPFDLPNDYMTDDKGRINLGDVAMPSPGSIRAEIRMPSETLVLSPADLGAEEKFSHTIETSSGEMIEIVVRELGEEGRVSISIKSTGWAEEGRSVKAAIRVVGTEGPPRIVTFDELGTDVGDIDRSRELEIIFYE